MRYWDALNPHSMADVIAAARTTGTTLQHIGRQHGEVILKALMVKFLGSFLQFYSFARMEDSHRAEIINLIIDEYPYFTLVDLKLFFTQAKKGHFGELYGRLDGPIILSWLRKYNSIRRESLENHRRRQQMEEAVRQNRDRQAYAESEEYRENCRHAQEGYQLLLKRLSESEYGLTGKKRRK